MLLSSVTSPRFSAIQTRSKLLSGTASSQQPGISGIVERHTKLEDGEYFGDLSLLLGEKRTASVRTLTYCEVFLLTRDDFERIRREYPKFREVLKKMSSERTEKTQTLILEGIVL